MKQTQVTEEYRGDGILVQHAKMIGFKKSIDNEFPVHLEMKRSRSIVMIARYIVAA